MLCRSLFRSSGTKIGVWKVMDMFFPKASKTLSILSTFYLKFKVIKALRDSCDSSIHTVQPQIVLSLDLSFYHTTFAPACSSLWRWFPLMASAVDALWIVSEHQSIPRSSTNAVVMAVFSPRVATAERLSLDAVTAEGKVWLSACLGQELLSLASGKGNGKPLMLMPTISLPCGSLGLLLWWEMPSFNPMVLFCKESSCDISAFS